MFKPAFQKTATAALALATALAAAPAAQAQVSQLFGNGTYLFAPVTRTWLDCYGITVPSTNPRPSLCPTPIENIQYFYAGTGSGAGIENFIQQNSKATGGLLELPPFLDPATGVTSYPYTRPNGEIVPDFSMDAAVFTPTQDGAYANLARRTRSKYWRLPVVAGTVGMPFSAAKDINGVGLPENLNLTRAQYCDLWSGKVLNWSELNLLNADGTSAGPGPNLPVVRVVRADNSGGTYALTNHLTQACRDLDADGVPESSYPWTEPFQERSIWGITEYPDNSPIISGNGAPRQLLTLISTPGAIGYVTAMALDPFTADRPQATSLQTGHSVHSIAKGGTVHQFVQPNAMTARTALTGVKDIYTISSSMRDSKQDGAYPITAPGFALLYCKYDAQGVAKVPQGVSQALKNFFGWALTADPDGQMGTADDPVADKLAATLLYSPLPNTLKAQSRKALSTIDTDRCTGSGPFGTH
ncbi:MAG: substrate-binding domain-containing protein [Aphanocapsa lilacina HA4352-LM1]|jgi:ABC-type phosphate transport system substrate-binding protein|nr:substrate-binding domain-containing protein [Aphanocapsa lilacina HA4352-LM1]